MSDDNHRFTITDERLEWDEDGPWSSPESPEDPHGVRSDTARSPERTRTLLIAGEGGLAGGLLGAFVTTIVMLSTSSSGSASPRLAEHLTPAHQVSSAVVSGPSVPPREDPATATDKARAPRRTARPKRPHAGKAPRIGHRQARKGARPHAQTPAAARIHHPPRKHHPKATHRHHDGPSR